MKKMIKLQLCLSFLILFSIFQSCNSVDENSTNETNEVTPDLTQLDSLIKASPKNAELYFERALFNYENGNQPKAMADIYSAILLDSINAKYYYLGGDLFADAGDINKAIALMSKGISLMPEDEELYIKATEFNFLAGNHQSALNFVNDLLELNSYNADAYFFKGLIYKDIKNTDKAISAFQTCVEVDPEYYNAYMQLALINSHQKNDIAIQYFENALRIKESSREALYGIAYHYQNKKEYNKAIAAYKKMFQINPKDHEVLFNIGHCYIGVDSLSKAYSNFDLATKIQPQYTGAYYMKGYTSELMNNKEDALFNYKQALNLLPGDSTIEKAIKRIK